MVLKDIHDVDDNEHDEAGNEEDDDADGNDEDGMEIERSCVICCAQNANEDRMNLISFCSL